MPRATEFSWHGPEIMARVHRAKGRGLIGIGTAVSTEGKRRAHVLTGTMRRSIHTAEPNYTGGDDEAQAADGQELPNLTEAHYQDDEAVLEVGSWVAYACVEEVGRGHQFMTPAVELVRGPRAEALMARAAAEEGLV